MVSMTTNVTDSRAPCPVRSSSSSHTTASTPSPGAASSARSAASDTTVSRVSSTIPPRCPQPSPRRASSTPSTDYARDVGLHDVAGRIHHHAAQAHDVHRTRLAGQYVDHRVDEAGLRIRAE